MQKQQHDVITEGSVNISNKSLQILKSQDNHTLFYNPSQVFNRDISLLVVKTYAQQLVNEAFNKSLNGKTRHINTLCHGVKICEPLAASGVRSLRYAKEIPSSLINSVTANDICTLATEQCNHNRVINGIDDNKLIICNFDGNYLLYKQKFEFNNLYNIIDVDPYGTISPFLDSCLSCIANKGMVCLTSTDMPVLGGNCPEVAFYKYGGINLKAPFLHELSLRLVLYQIINTAAKYKRNVTPYLSLSVDFYVRFFVKVEDKPLLCKHNACESSILLYCFNCTWFECIPLATQTNELKNTQRNLTRRSHKTNNKNLNEQHISATNAKYTTSVFKTQMQDSLCPQCSTRVHIGGPFYSGPLFNQEFVDKLIIEHDKSIQHTNDSEQNTTSNDHHYTNNSDHINHSNHNDDHHNNIKDSTDVDNLFTTFNSQMNTFKFSHLNKVTRRKISAILNVIKEDVPQAMFYYSLPTLCSKAHISSPKLHIFKSIIQSLGFEVGIFHRDADSIKTTAPSNIVFDLLRAWIVYSKDDNPKRPEYWNRQPHISPTVFEQAILREKQNAEAKNKQSTNDTLANKKIRFTQNPTANWGPLSRGKQRRQKPGQS